MGKLFKNKKVVAAAVTLVLVILGTALGTDLDTYTASSVTDLICTIVICQ